MIRARPAPVGVVPAAHPGGDPHPAQFVQHGVVHVGPGIPDGFIAPIRGFRRGRTGDGARLGVHHGQWNLVQGVIDGVEHRQVVGAFFQGTVDFAIGVDGGVAPVGGDQVMEIGGGIGPVPLGDDHVALQSLGPRRRRRQFAGGDAVGPVGEHADGAFHSQAGQGADHGFSGLTGQDAARPGISGGIITAEQGREFPCRFIAHLMTAQAAAGGDQADKVRLVLDVGADAVARRTGAGEFAPGRHFQQGVPVAGRVVLRCRRFIGGGHRREVQIGAR